MTRREVLMHSKKLTSLAVALAAAATMAASAAAFSAAPRASDPH
jgi:hypothetical protein